MPENTAISEISIEDAVKFHSHLNPSLWNNGKLKPEIRLALFKIAKDFVEFINVPNLYFKDITLTGSNASFTYTQHSDIDLHIIVDTPDDQRELYTSLFDGKKNSYNFIHDIKIKGFDVELYVQEQSAEHHSQGVYSVFNDQWLIEPKRTKASINDSEVLDKYENYLNKIRLALKSKEIGKAKAVFDELKKIRKAGLAREGEFGSENLVFKLLRNKGAIERLTQHIRNLEDQELSLENKMKISELEQVLNVEKDDDRETHLVDPKTGTKTIIDKTKNPTAISPDQTGKLKLSKSGQTGGQTGGQKQSLQGKQVTVTDALDRIKELAGLANEATPEAAPPTIKPVQVPQFPQMPQQDGDLGQGMQAGTNKDGTKFLSGGQGTFIWDKAGKPSKYQAPSFAGIQQTVDVATGDITVNYGNGPMAVSAVYDKSGKIKQGQGSASYDFGIAKAQTGPQGSSMTVRSGTPGQDQTVAVN